MPNNIHRPHPHPDIPDHEEVLMHWEALEYAVHPPDPKWYIFGGIGAVGLIVYSVIVKNFLFALAIAIIGVLIYLHFKELPRSHKIAITQKGIRLDKSLFNYHDLDTFWINYKPPAVKVLHIKRKGVFAPELVIQLENQNPLKVRDILLGFLKEDVTREESRMDRFTRKLGF